MIHQTAYPSPRRWSQTKDRATSWALALLQVVGVMGLFAGVTGMSLFLAAGVAWLGQGSDGGFSRVGWSFLMSGLVLGGLGLLGDAWGQLHGQSRERALALSGGGQGGSLCPMQAPKGISRHQGPSRAA